MGRGYAKKLEARGLYTMGDIARCSVGRPADFYNEELLYQAVRRQRGAAHRPRLGLGALHHRGHQGATGRRTNSIGSGQVLQRPYPLRQGAGWWCGRWRTPLALDLVDKGLATDQLVLTVGYDNENVSRFGSYQGEIKSDRYGRQIPKPAHGVTRLPEKTASSRRIIEAVGALFEEIVDRRLTIRRMNLTALEVTAETEESRPPEQLNMFTDYAAEERRRRRKRPAWPGRKAAAGRVGNSQKIREKRRGAGYGFAGRRYRPRSQSADWRPQGVMGKYDDILNQRRPASRRPKMSALERAAQFSPFAALTGYEDAVRESARRTEDRRSLSQEEMDFLNRQLCYLADRTGEGPWAAFTCFVPDARKAGGAYETFTGRVKRVGRAGRMRNAHRRQTAANGVYLRNR